MYTTFDKALVTLILAGVQLANVFGVHFGLDPTTVTTVVSIATPVIVWLFPNLPKDA